MTIFLPFVVLVPANLITNPVKALENFFVVFIQRYCNEADSSLPSFCLQTFSEAFAQSVGIQRAYEVCSISPSYLPYKVNRCLLLSWLLLRFVNESFNTHLHFWQVSVHEINAHRCIPRGEGDQLLVNWWDGRMCVCCKNGSSIPSLYPSQVLWTLLLMGLVNFWEFFSGWNMFLFKSPTMTDCHSYGYGILIYERFNLLNPDW